MVFKSILRSEFRKSEITFLGQIISKEGVRVDDSKIAAMVNTTEPTDVAELRRYLGMVNYLGSTYHTCHPFFDL